MNFPPSRARKFKLNVGRVYLPTATRKPKAATPVPHSPAPAMAGVLSRIRKLQPFQPTRKQWRHGINAVSIKLPASEQRPETRREKRRRRRQESRRFKKEKNKAARLGMAPSSTIPADVGRVLRLVLTGYAYRIRIHGRGESDFRFYATKVIVVL